jgi:hypothetical protein
MEQTAIGPETQAGLQFTPHFSEVPVDIYRFFGIDLGTAEGRELDKLKDISKWAFEGVDSLGDAMLKLRGLETSLPAPRIGETIQTKMHNWIKLQSQITDLRKRQEAI